MYVNELELLRLKLKLDNRTLSRLLYESEVWLWLITKELKDLKSLIAYKLQLSTSE
jgi:hypothetical protein